MQKLALLLLEAIFAVSSYAQVFAPAELNAWRVAKLGSCQALMGEQESDMVKAIPTQKIDKLQNPVKSQPIKSYVDKDGHVFYSSSMFSYEGFLKLIQKKVSPLWASAEFEKQDDHFISMSSLSAASFRWDITHNFEGIPFSVEAAVHHPKRVQELENAKTPTTGWVLIRSSLDPLGGVMVQGVLGKFSDHADLSYEFAGVTLVEDNIIPGPAPRDVRKRNQWLELSSDIDN